MAQGGPEAVDHIVQEVDGLSSDQVVDEFSDFLNRDTLTRIVAAEGVAQALKYTGAVERAIGKVDAPNDRTALGTEAFQSVGQILFDPKFKANSFGSALGLLEQNGRYAELIDNPKERATMLSYAADTAFHLSKSYEVEQETLSLGQHAITYLDRAAESALAIDNDPSSEVSSLRYTAEVSTRSSGLISNLSLSDGEQQQLITDLLAQPAPIYNKALAAASVIPERESRLEEQGLIAISMAKFATNVSGVSPELSEQLVNMAAAEIDDILAEFDTDRSGAAHNLVDIGEALSETIEKHYASPDQDDVLRQRLVGKMLDVFKAIGRYVEEASDPSLEENEYQGDDFASNVTSAAEKLLSSDFAIAKELFSISFSLAVEQTKSGFGDEPYASNEVLRAIQDGAKEQTALRPAFELLSLGYQLERNRLPDGQASSIMQRNALRGLRDLPEEPVDQDVAVEEIDPQFAEFCILTALTDTNARNGWIKPLQVLGRHVEDPDLEQRIRGQLDTLEARQAERQRPKGKIAMIAEANWPSS